MILTFMMICKAPTPYRWNLLFDFEAQYRREPTDHTTLAEWWELPSPPHHRLDALIAAATAHPEHEASIFAALQTAAAIAGCELPADTPIVHWHLFTDRVLDPRRQPPTTIAATESVLSAMVTELMSKP